MRLQCSSSPTRPAWPDAWLDGLPLLLLPALAIATRNLMPAWVFMWLLSVAIFSGCKWLTLRRARTVPSRRAALTYLFAWPGMDANAFLARKVTHHPTPGHWLIAAGKTLAGAALLLMATRPFWGLNPLLKGWLGMIGLVMLLHFGLFHLLALGWRAVGREAQPLMHAPLLATSLADF